MHIYLQIYANILFFKGIYGLPSIKAAIYTVNINFVAVAKGHHIEMQRK